METGSISLLFLLLARLAGVHKSCWLYPKLLQNCQVTEIHKQGYLESNDQICLQYNQYYVTITEIPTLSTKGGFRGGIAAPTSPVGTTL